MSNLKTLLQTPLHAWIFADLQRFVDDDDCYSMFWERVEALGKPIYLHASDPLVPPVTYNGCPRLTGAVWSWTAETAAHALRLIFNDTFTKYPKIKLILGHMGETLPFLLWQIDRRTKAFATGPALTPSEIIKKNFVITTSGVFADSALLCALADIVSVARWIKSASSSERRSEPSAAC